MRVFRGRTGADGVVDVEHVVRVGPGEFAGHQVHLEVGAERAVLDEQAVQAGGAGAALQPEQHGCVLRRFLGEVESGGQSGLWTGRVVTDHWNKQAAHRPICGPKA